MEEGRYAVVISYSPKMQQWLPILLGVPNREVGKVLDSRIWVHRLKQKIVEAKDKGEAVWITVK
jgi:hypothetical protein